jgi:ABC-type transporter Mla MlaB component
VSIRIEVTGQNEATTVSVAGWLDGDAVDELSRACREIEGPVTLELSELLTADAAGIELLRELRERGAGLRGLSPYLRLLM